MIDSSPSNAQYYEIRLKGRLEARWVKWFDGLAITLEENSNTLLSGPEIAQQLIVSLNTLRTHTKSIFNKLGVNNRRAAIRRAEELDLF